MQLSSLGEDLPGMVSNTRPASPTRAKKQKKKSKAAAAAAVPGPAPLGSRPGSRGGAVPARPAPLPPSLVRAKLCVRHNYLIISVRYVLHVC